MKPFSFRLESVLNYRKFQEKKALMQLMRENKAYGEIEKSISQFESKKSDVEKKCYSASLNGVSAFRYQAYKAYLDELRHDIDKAYIKLKEQEKTIREKEMVLKHETTKKKVLEKLRDHQLEEYGNLAEKAEQKKLDELIINQRGAMP